VAQTSVSQHVRRWGTGDGFHTTSRTLLDTYCGRLEL